MKKKIALILAASFLLTCVPFTAYSDETEVIAETEDADTAEEIEYTDDDAAEDTDDNIEEEHGEETEKTTENVIENDTDDENDIIDNDTDDEEIIDNGDYTDDEDDDDGYTETDDLFKTVAKPVIKIKDLGGGTYSVKIWSGEYDTVYYTIDGSVPTFESGLVYTEPFNAVSGTKIIAFSANPNNLHSQITAVIIKLDDDEDYTDDDLIPFSDDDEEIIEEEDNDDEIDDDEYDDEIDDEEYDDEIDDEEYDDEYYDDEYYDDGDYEDDGEYYDDEDYDEEYDDEYEDEDYEEYDDDEYYELEDLTEADTDENGAGSSVKMTVGSQNISVNDMEMTMDVSPYIQESSNSTMVPLRFCTLDLGEASEINWDPNTKEADIYWIGSGYISFHIVQFFADSNVVLIDGEEQEMENGATAEIKDGRIFVPLREFGKAIGAGINWDSELKTVILSLE